MVGLFIAIEEIGSFQSMARCRSWLVSPMSRS